MPPVAQTYGSFRAEDLLAPGMPEKFVEIVEGELVVMTPSGRRHNVVCNAIFLQFNAFCERHAGLECGAHNDGFLLKRGPDTLLCPDVSLFRARPDPSEPWLIFGPEIAVEVLSPSNTRTEMLYKIREYFAAGAEQVWIVDPIARSIDFHFKDGRLLSAHGDDVVIGEGIVAGMEIRLAEIFRKA